MERTPRRTLKLMAELILPHPPPRDFLDRAGPTSRLQLARKLHDALPDPLGDRRVLRERRPQRVTGNGIAPHPHQKLKLRLGGPITDPLSER
jgi:hypothetical protein